MDQKNDKRISRRSFLAGAVLGGAGMWAAGILPRRIYTGDEHIPPHLYEYYVDNYWFESANMFDSDVNPPLKGRQRADIAIIGGGFAGMSTAYNLAKRLPRIRIVLLEGARCGYGASGRNGGFAGAGMHGLDKIFDEEGPEAAREMYETSRLGLGQIRTFVEDYGLDCDLMLTGTISSAVNQGQLDQLVEHKKRYKEMLGIELELLDAGEIRRRINSEGFIGGLYDPDDAYLNPAKLARGMKRVIEGLGVEVSERSKVVRIDPGGTVRIVTEFAEVIADKVVIALNGYAPQLGLFTDRIVSIVAHMAATEPLSNEQMASIGWTGREGLIDRGQYLHIRPTADNRIVFGNLGGRLNYDNMPSSGNYKPDIESMCSSFLAAFPQLEGVRFSHVWGGTLGMSRDLTPSVGAFKGSKNIFHAVAFSGGGVTTCQLAGQAVADLIVGEETPMTKLPFVNKKMPYTGFEPIRSMAYSIIQRTIPHWY